MRNRIAAGALLLLLAGCGCGGAACADEGRHRLDFTPDWAWPARNYELDVTIGDQVTNCSISLPSAHCSAIGLCFGPGLGRIELHCDADGSASGIKSLSVNRPESDFRVRVTVRDDSGKVLASLEDEPELSTLEPNGARCEPTCSSSRVTVVNVKF